MRYRPHKPVSPIRIIISTLVGLTLGTSLAVVLLILQPVNKVRTIPEEEKRPQIGKTVVHYAPGLVSINRSAIFDRNYNRIVQRTPGTYELLEGDLNAFLKGFVPTGAAGEGNEAQGVKIAAPNVRITEENLIFSMGVTVSPGTAQAKEMIVQIEGTVENGAGGPQFKVSNVSINSLKLPSFLSKGFQTETSGNLPQELLDAWASIETVELQRGRLVVKVSPS